MSYVLYIFIMCDVARSVNMEEEKKIIYCRKVYVLYVKDDGTSATTDRKSLLQDNNRLFYK